MAGKGGKGRDGGATIVIKRIEEGGHGHHGGAWKVAYADFVTAMMAFFLLMWLLNATSEEQRRGIADFFSPVNVLGHSTSGSGLPFGGRTPNSTGNLVSDSGAMNPTRSAAPARLEIEEEDEDAENVVRHLGRGEGRSRARAARGARPAATATDADGPAGEALAGPDARPRASRAAPRRPGSAARPAPRSPAPMPRRRSPGRMRRGCGRRRCAPSWRGASTRPSTRPPRSCAPRCATTPRWPSWPASCVVEMVPEGLRIQLLDAERRRCSRSAAPRRTSARAR